MMDIRMHDGKDRWVERRMDGCTAGWKKGYMDGRMDVVRMGG